jgi:hypothetical protein
LRLYWFENWYLIRANINVIGIATPEVREACHENNDSLIVLTFQRKKETYETQNPIFCIFSASWGGRKLKEHLNFEA